MESLTKQEELVLTKQEELGEPKPQKGLQTYYDSCVLFLGGEGEWYYQNPLTLTP